MFNPGDVVAVSASVQPGAFEGEYLVTVITTNGPVSGFARESELVGPERKNVHAVVRDVKSSTISVILSGSYFTTNGIAELPAEWAKKHVRVIA